MHGGVTALVGRVQYVRLLRNAPPPLCARWRQLISHVPSRGSCSSRAEPTGTAGASVAVTAISGCVAGRGRTNARLFSARLFSAPGSSLQLLFARALLSAALLSAALLSAALLSAALLRARLVQLLFARALLRASSCPQAECQTGCCHPVLGATWRLSWPRAFATLLRHAASLHRRRPSARCPYHARRRRGRHRCPLTPATWRRQGPWRRRPCTRSFTRF